MATSIASLKITWEPLPDDFILPDDPVDNINQPALAAALTDSLQNAGRLPPNSLTPTNYGICATVNDKIVIKAPDWAFIPEIRVPRTDIQRSYTPQLQGDIPLLVVEFLSDTEGGEYSIKSTYPPGKWFFYQTILQVKYYVIFEPQQGILEVYGLNEKAEYQLQTANAENRYFIPEMHLYLGVWQGTRENRTGYWLRWWDENENLLLWGFELAEIEHQRAEKQLKRAEILAAQLRAAGIEPEV